MMKCELCGEDFIPIQGEEEARKEFAKNYPGIEFKRDEVVALCDRCYHEWLPWLAYVKKNGEVKS